MFKKRKLGSNHWDAIHEKLKGQKRGATEACPASYSLCASSLGGGCCPTDRSCGVSSCFATATTTTTGCPIAFTTCGVVDGGGCCPSGYSCERNTCIAPTGGSATSVCGANSFLCPSSLSFGCCRNGLSCGISTCYETTSTTSVTLTLTVTTTNSNSALTTITTVLETAYNPPTPTPDQAPLLTPIAKLPASTTSATPSNNTPTTSKINVKQLGGIVGACVFLLLVLLLATYLILRRLNLTIKLTKAGRGANHPGRSNSYSPNNIQIQSLDIDPLQEIPSSRTGTRSHHPRTNQTTPSELSDNNGTGTRQSNARGARGLPLVSFSPLVWPASATSRSGNGRGSSGVTGAYRSLPSSDGSRHWRNDSEGSQAQSISNPTTNTTTNAYTAELQSPEPPQSYFEIPIPKTASAFTDANIDPALRDQNLRFGHTASEQRPSIDQTRGGHGRQWSDVSELSNGTETTNESYELDDTSPKSPHSHKYGSKSREYGYNSLYGSSSHADKRSLREGVKNKVQDWVGMTGLGRKTSRRRDEGFSFNSGGLGGFKVIPSPTISASPTSMSYPNSASTTPTLNQDQEHLLRNNSNSNSNTTHAAPFQSFTRFGDKGRLEAIREALRESGTTVATSPTAGAKDESGAGQVSESRAQIARMEIKRVDSDLTSVDGNEVAGRDTEGGYKDLVV